MDAILKQIRGVLGGVETGNAKHEMRNGGGHRRAAYEWLRMAGELRAGRMVVGLEKMGKRVMGSEDVTEVLWGCYLLLLGERFCGVGVERGVIEGLWEKGVGMQGEEGYLHLLGAETLLDGFIYEDLCAIHAGFGVAVLLGDAGKMERVRRAVGWHVENTQPDHTTTEPWGMPAFARLEEGGMFARQQLHDAVFQLNRTPVLERGGSVVVGLLAEAAAMMESDGGFNHQDTKAPRG